MVSPGKGKVHLRLVLVGAETWSFNNYLMLHSLGVLQFPKCGTTSHRNGDNYATTHQNADNFVINSYPQCIVTFK